MVSLIKKLCTREYLGQDLNQTSIKIVLLNCMASGQILNWCERLQFRENELNQPVELFEDVSLIFEQAGKVNKT